jgi:hypothetical protein
MRPGVDINDEPATTNPSRLCAYRLPRAGCAGGLAVMKEVMTLAGPTTNSVFANSEDGHLYRWNLKTNAVAESIKLNDPLPQAYTAIIVGMDGVVYTTNNSTFYAIRR